MTNREDLKKKQHATHRGIMEDYREYYDKNGYVKKEGTFKYEGLKTKLVF